MKNILHALLLLFTLVTTAHAADGVKVIYFGGMNMMDRKIEINMGKSYTPEDQTIATIFNKVKAIGATGRMDYLVPDAPYIELAVTYNGETVVAKNAMRIPKVPGYEAYQKAWDAAYALVWGLLEPRFRP